MELQIKISAYFVTPVLFQIPMVGTAWKLVLSIACLKIHLFHWRKAYTKKEIINARCVIKVIIPINPGSADLVAQAPLLLSKVAIFIRG